MTPTYDPPRPIFGHSPDRTPDTAPSAPPGSAPGLDLAQPSQDVAAADHDHYGRPVQVFNLRYLPGFLARRRAEGETPAEGADRPGRWLLVVASVLLLLLAAAQGYVSYRAQYAFVHAEKGEKTASTLEALGLDAAAVIFALLALAQARLGRTAVTERALNLACVIGSLCMNALSADPGSAKSVAAWVMPAALYAAASDRLIAVVRQRALADRDGAEEGSPLAAARGLALWVLRFAMAPWSTLGGFRDWVLDEAPVAPGRRALPTPDKAHGKARKKLPALPWRRDTDRDTEADTGADSGHDSNDADGDSHPDTTPDTDRDTDADNNGDSNGGNGPDGKRRVSRPRRRSGGKTTGKTALDKARALLAADPTMSGAELGRRLKVSDRTGQRLYAQITADSAKGDDAR
ncbi:DUF2637 domain-containing protein [Actinomadura montaniterrae]|uniref:DUF2637 domain-containing protein n=1 Tax=Actinomadura montaniterrae TaxID=1803903 RepID=A0A6L3VMW9_9ACTN|nr:DUF2637 domain-containing protein [Actinomadura montaniterrae]KAB2371126.1 hypothetical protein F9B16_32950 [Actinomadura montaniterrae]